MKIFCIIASYIVALFPAGWGINSFLSRYESEVEMEEGLKNAGKYIG